MQITLGYSDVEAAVRNYVKTLGIDKEVTEINFIQQRKADSPIRVELTLDTVTAVPQGPIPRETKPMSKLATVPEETVTEETPEETPEAVSEPKNLFGN